ncbi:MAG: hypothetical protein CL908_00715 [Deltaproteobacteria bacterium]|nr:hypothetical protein [Deltaproteobacteria bacterium]
MPPLVPRITISPSTIAEIEQTVPRTWASFSISPKAWTISGKAPSAARPTATSAGPSEKVFVSGCRSR